MIRTIKNVWTLTVNLGWLCILAVIGTPYALKQLDAQPPISTEQPAEQVVEKVVETEVQEPQIEPKLETKRPVQKLDENGRNRILWVPPEPVAKEVPQDPINDPDPIRDPVENPFVNQKQAIFQINPNLSFSNCSNGLCYIVPELKYDGPSRYNPMPTDFEAVRGKSPTWEKARATNNELRWDVWNLSQRLVWNKTTVQFLDLNDLDSNPMELDEIYDQNYKITWRINQLKRLMAGIPPEEKMPARPPGLKGKIGGLFRDSQN